MGKIKKNWNQEQETELLHGYLDGESIPSLAKRLNKSHKSIINRLDELFILLEAGRELPPKPVKADEDIIQANKKAKSLGLSYGQYVAMQYEQKLLKEKINAN